MTTFKYDPELNKGIDQAKRAFMFTLETGAPGISAAMRQALWETFNRRFTHEIMEDYRKNGLT